MQVVQGVVLMVERSRDGLEVFKVKVRLEGERDGKICACAKMAWPALFMCQA
jgi:hypothetical protein